VNRAWQTLAKGHERRLSDPRLTSDAVVRDPCRTDGKGQEWASGICILLRGGWHADITEDSGELPV
jgi:hypothetical protein